MQLLCIYLCLHPTTHLKSWPGAKCAQLQNDAYLFLALKQRRNCAARSYTSAVAAVLWTLAFYWPPINLPGPQTTQSNLGRKNDRCLKLKTQLKLWVKGGQHKVTKWDTGPLCFRGCGGLGGSRQPIWYSSMHHPASNRVFSRVHPYIQLSIPHIEWTEWQKLHEGAKGLSKKFGLRRKF